MKYVYSAIFTPFDDGQYDVYIPDLLYCRTCGKNLAEAMEMAIDAASRWLAEAEKDNIDIPIPSKTLDCSLPQFVSLILADTNEYRRKQDVRAVKKTLTIPAWLNEAAEKAQVNFSGILQKALKEHLNL